MKKFSQLIYENRNEISVITFILLWTLTLLFLRPICKVIYQFLVWL
jgi:hypothetical protein